MIMENEKLNKLIDQRALKIVREYMKSSAFTDRKLTDTPTDNLAVVPRKYVNLYGTTRPVSSVIGQRFFDTSLATNGQLIVWNGTGWVDPTGSYV